MAKKNRKHRVGRNLKKGLGAIQFFDGGDPNQSPPSAYKRFETVRLTIYPRGEDYVVQASVPQANGMDSDLPSQTINWSRKDLFEHSKELVEELENLTRSDKKIRDSSTINVARMGALIFRKMFPDLNVRNLVKRHIINGSLTCLIVNSKHFNVPFNFLYLGDDLDNVDPMNFIGLNAVVIKDMQRILQSSPTDLFSLQRLEVADEFRIAYAWDDNLSEVQKTELPFIQSMDSTFSTPHVKVSQIPKLNDNEGRQQNCLYLFEGINESRPHLFHLSCHFQNGETHEQRYFTIRSNCSIRQTDIKLSDVTFDSRPVVFFNACRVAHTNPYSSDDYVDFYLQIGARCLIAPECRVVDKTASSFVPYFYREFVSYGRPIAEALYQARLKFWNSEGDLSGLVYSIYGQAHTEIVKGAVK